MRHLVYFLHITMIQYNRQTIEDVSLQEVYNSHISKKAGTDEAQLMIIIKIYPGKTNRQVHTRLTKVTSMIILLFVSSLPQC